MSSEVITIDDFGDTLRLAAPPLRIVSLTPASTELVFALGAGRRLVGRTRWDIWPDSATLIPDVGDGIRPNVEAVLGTQPDLVLLYASNENRAAARRLRDAGVQTLSLKVDLPIQFAELARVLGLVLRDTVAARVVVDSVQNALDMVRLRTSGAHRPSVFWIADLEPLIAIGGGSFLSELISIAGGSNIYADIAEPSAPISLEDVLKRNPDVIFGGRAAVEHVKRSAAWRGTNAVRRNRVLESEPYSMGRPSVRMGEAALQLARMLHPELFP